MSKLTDAIVLSSLGLQYPPVAQSKHKFSEIRRMEQYVDRGELKVKIVGIVDGKIVTEVLTVPGAKRGINARSGN